METVHDDLQVFEEAIGIPTRPLAQGTEAWSLVDGFVDYARRRSDERNLTELCQPQPAAANQLFPVQLGKAFRCKTP